MPIHDWTRVRANRFHHFHQTWTANLAATLNSGRLPPGFFALTEQITGGPEADVVALEFSIAEENLFDAGNVREQSLHRRQVLSCAPRPQTTRERPIGSQFGIPTETWLR